jgi:hypothetical protein
MAELLAKKIDLKTQLAYRVPGVVRALDCTEHVARRMIERGVIPSRRLGRRVIVLAAELETYLMSLPQSGQDM